MTSLATVLLLGLALFAGSFVQSSIGFGMAIVAAPFVVLAAPELMPGALLVTTLSLPVVTLAHGPRDIAWHPLGWALAARLVTMPLGVAAVAMLSTRLISALVGVLILITAVASVTTLDIRPTRGAAVAAGAVAGVSGTAASIGGPFLALMLQRESPARQRASLAVFLAVGGLMALAGLAVAGQFHWQQARAGLTWLPFIAAGYAAAAPARAHLDQGRMQRVVAAFCVVASLSVIARALFS
ncbi:MAG: TSUP family transporter [Micrococcales bacterium]|nr:TSUP family transporter [Micrococcales bacterium]